MTEKPLDWRKILALVDKHDPQHPSPGVLPWQWHLEQWNKTQATGTDPQQELSDAEILRRFIKDKLKA